MTVQASYDVGTWENLREMLCPRSPRGCLWAAGKGALQHAPPSWYQAQSVEGMESAVKNGVLRLHLADGETEVQGVKRLFETEPMGQRLSRE